MAEKYIYDANGIRMNYATFGDGSECIVILPGISIKSVVTMADSVEASYCLPEYKNRFVFYLFDQKEDPPMDYSIKNMADDLSWVIRDLGLNKLNILGASLGGMMAFAMGAYYPELVNKLCLVSTAPTAPPSFKKVLPEWISLGREHNITALAPHFADDVYSAKTLSQFRDSIISSILDATESELDNYAIRSEAMLKWDLGDDIKKIQAPAIAIGSRGDTLYGYECTLQTGESLGCETFLYGPEYGHAVYDEAPDFPERILKFFAK